MLQHALQLLLLLAMWAAPLPLCAWLCGRDRVERAFAHDLLVLGVFWLAVQMTIPMLLGAVGHLGATGVYALESLVLVGGLVLMWRRPGRRLRAFPRAALGEFELGLLFVGFVLLGLSYWSLLGTPTSNYDSFAYHLPAMAWWAQHGSFEFLPDLQHAAYYAFNWEVASLLSFYPMHSDLFIAAPNLFAWALWGLAIFQLARAFGATRGAALCAALLLLATRTVLTRLDAAQPDLVLAAYFVTAIYLGLGALSERSAWLGACALFCVLMLSGLKMSGLVYAPLAVVAIFALHFARARSWTRPVWSVRTQGALLVWGLFLGAFWYLRNLALNGNPFGFLSIELFGREIFHGEQSRAELARTALVHVFDPTRVEHWKILALALWQHLGPGFALIGLGASAAWLHRDRRLLAALSLVGLAALWAYWSAPYSGDNGSRDYQFTPWFTVGLRYAYPLLSLLAIAAALGLTRLRIGTRIGLVLVMVCALHLLVWQLKSPGLAVRWSVGAGLVLGACVQWRARLPRRWLLGALGVLSFSALAWQSQRLDIQREEQRQKQYGFLHAYMEEKVGDDAVVGYARTHRRYQLFGKRLQREVICMDARTESVEEWLARLRAAQIELLAVGTADDAEIARKGLPDVRAWIEARPDDFELLFPAQSELKDLELYRVR